MRYKYVYIYPCAEDQYDVLDVGSGRGDNAVNLDTRVAQLSGYVNESFTTNSALMWLAFNSDASNNFGGFEIRFFDGKMEVNLSVS